MKKSDDEREMIALEVSKMLKECEKKGSPDYSYTAYVAVGVLLGGLRKHLPADKFRETFQEYADNNFGMKLVTTD